jgi:hypothetical protein
MNDTEQIRSQLLAQMGYKSLSRTWAKIEIFICLGAAGVGMLLSQWAISRLFMDIPAPATAEIRVGSVIVGISSLTIGLVLFMLGGYLTLAGHRSHLYQSQNELTAYLVREFRRLQEKG